MEYQDYNKYTWGWLMESGIEAVSYTHLDVYKRQHYRSLTHALKPFLNFSYICMALTINVVPDCEMHTVI